MSTSSQRKSEPSTRYDRICTLHGKKISDEGDLCPAGHVALSYERRVRHEPVLERKPDMPPSRPVQPGLPITPTSPPPATSITKSVLLKPRRFVDDAGRAMTLRIKETKANGWAIHCRLEEPDPGKKGKLKTTQQGLTRIHGLDLEKCKREFFDLCTGSEKAGWVDAPARGRKLMDVPQPQKRGRP